MNDREAAHEISMMERIDQICEEFEAAHQAGESPKPEQFFHPSDDDESDQLLRELIRLDIEYRRRQNERVAVDEYQARFPANAELISSVFDDELAERETELVFRCPNCRASVVADASVEFDSLACQDCGTKLNVIVARHDDANARLSGLGHFELKEELGTGGFGTVWRAHDTKLGRDVAIKLPHVSMIVGRHAEQFLREARTAASLKHSNIVSVHEVGREENDLYIVSDLIDGQALSDWLENEKPTLREAVVLCIKLADALHHAHEAGVVHRDLKPSNVLMDKAGEPHITDFGLAKSDATDVSMTPDGVVLGTPAYMSPEQARGDARDADRRSDVYSLGVMLFELLTGERPFRGSRDMVLHQILNADGPKPSQFAKLTRDLDTICLKCFEKAPDRRYASAKALAEDLQRFLNHEPIIARPISSVERFSRLCRRNPMITTLTTLIIALLVTIVAMLYVSRENIASALKEEERLNEELDASLKKEKQLTKALGTVKESTDTQWKYFSRDPRLISEGLEPWRRDMLAELLPAYETLAKLGGDEEPQSQADLAHTLLILGTLTAQTKTISDGLPYDERALEVLEQLTANHPDSSEYAIERGIVLRNIGYLHYALGQFEEAEEAHADAVDLLNKLSGVHPDDVDIQLQLAIAQNYLGEVLMKGNRINELELAYDSALSIFRQLIDEHEAELSEDGSFGEARYFYGMTLFNLGIARAMAGSLSDAEQPFRDARDVYEALVADQPDVPKYRSRLVRSYLNLGFWLVNSNKPAEALVVQQLALAASQKLVAEHPAIHEFRDELVGVHSIAAFLHQQLRDLDKAETSLGAAIDVAQQAVDDFPKVDKLRTKLAESYNDRGRYHLRSDSLQAEKDFKSAIPILTDLADQEPKNFSLQVTLGGTYCNLGIAMTKAKPEAAASAFDKAIDRLTSVLEQDESIPMAKQFLKISENSRAKLIAQQEKSDEADQG